MAERLEATKPVQIDPILDPTWGLDVNIWKEIFRLLNPQSISAASLTSKSWKVIIDRDAALKLKRTWVYHYAFGKDRWEKYFGDIGAEPPLPANIAEILNSPCPFWSGKKVRETHLLVLVPQTVNGTSFCLDSLSEMIKSPKTGNKTQYDYYDDYIKKDLGTKSISSHWVLMTQNVIERIRNQSYDDQKKLVQSYAEKTQLPYEMPMFLDAATVILMQYIETGKTLYTDNKLGTQYTYTRCQEKVNNNQWLTSVGGFGAGGISIVSRWEFISGVGCCLKF